MKLTKGKKIALACFGVFLAFMVVCTVVANGIYASGLPKISTTKPYSGSLTHVITVNGTVMQGQEYGIYVEQGLLVDTLSVNSGDTFREGDPLFRIEVRDLSGILAERRLEISKLEVQMAEAVQEGERERQSRKQAAQRAREDYEREAVLADVEIQECQQAYDAAQRALGLYNQYLEDSSKPSDGGGQDGDMSGDAPTGGDLPGDNLPDGGGTGEGSGPGGNGDGQEGSGAEDNSGGDAGNGETDPDVGNGAEAGEGGTESTPVPDGNDVGKEMEAGNGAGAEAPESDGSTAGNGAEAGDGAGSGAEAEVPESGGSDTGNGADRGDEAETDAPESEEGNSETGSDGGGGAKPGAGGEESQEPTEGSDTGNGADAGGETGSDIDTGADIPASDETDAEGGSEGSGLLYEVSSEAADPAQQYSKKEKQLQLEQNVITTAQALEEAKKQKEYRLQDAARALEDAENAIDKANAEVNALALEVKYRKEGLQSLEELLQANGWVYAEASGRVTQNSLEVGKRTQDGAGLIYALDDGERVISASFDEGQEGYVSVGTQFDIKAVLPDGSRVNGTALLDYLEKGVDGIAYGRLSFDLPGLAIGQSAELTCRMQTDSFSTCVPRQCIYQESEEVYYVYTVEEQEGILGTEWKVRKADVRILDQNDTAVAIQSVGITSESRIVSGTNKHIFDGDTVRVVQ